MPRQILVLREVRSRLLELAERDQASDRVRPERVRWLFPPKREEPPGQLAQVAIGSRKVAERELEVAERGEARRSRDVGRGLLEDRENFLGVLARLLDPAEVRLQERLLIQNLWPQELVLALPGHLNRLTEGAPMPAATDRRANSSHIR